MLQYFWLEYVKSLASLPDEILSGLVFWIVIRILLGGKAGSWSVELLIILPKTLRLMLPYSPM